MFGKLISLFTIGSTLASLTLISRIFEELVALVALIVLSALMCAVLLIGTFYAMYFALTFYDVPPVGAFAVVAVVATIVTVVLIVLTKNKLEKLQILARKKSKPELPGISHSLYLVDSFVEGFLGQSDRRR